MEQVVPWPGSDQEPGYINLHWTSPKGPGMRGMPFKGLHDFMNMAQYAAAKPGVYKDIYFCLSKQSVTGKVIHGHAIANRNIMCATHLKAIWLDVDVKKDKGYATLHEALAAIDTFRRAINLPPPSALVFSGGGVHVYWASDRPLTKAEWRPYAEGLKAEVLRVGLKCDAGLTTDAARVLRVPGTFNCKFTPPAPVRLAHLGAAYDFAAVLSGLATIGAKAPVTAAVTGAKQVLPFDMSAFTGKRPALSFAHLDPQLDSLAEGIATRDDRPLNPDQVFKSCPHFRDAAVTHGQGHGQGLWMLTMLAATWFEDGRDWAHYMSKGYPTYTRDETDAMYDRKLKDRAEHGLGWPSCAKFEDEGCKLCKTCIYKGKLKSPLHLAERVQLPTIQSAEPPPPPPELDLPAGFTVAPEDGRIYEVVDKTLPNGVTVPEMLPLFWSKLSDPKLLSSPRRFTCTTSLDHGKSGAVSVREVDLASEQKMLTALRECGVKPYVPNQRRITHFMTSWMHKLDEAVARQQGVPFGWLMDGTVREAFSYGGEVFKRDGTRGIAGFADQELEVKYHPIGTIEPWMTVHNLVTSLRRPPLEALMAAFFAAPLMFVSAQYSGILIGFSNDSGAFKTTALACGQSIWGQPHASRENFRTSFNYLEGKLSTLRNLPILYDEINKEEKMDIVREYVNFITEGRSGGKMRSDRSMRDPGTWQTLVVMGANVSLYRNLVRHEKNTDASLQRVFEFECFKLDGTMPAHDAQRLVGKLDQNYGLMGRKYAQMLGTDPDGVDKFAKAILDKFDKRVGAMPEERYRVAMGALTLAGAHLANTLGCSFHLPELEEFLVQQFHEQRLFIDNSATIGGSSHNTVLALTHFFKTFGRNTLGVEALPMGKGNRAIGYLYGPRGNSNNSGPVHIRIAHTDRVIQFSKDEFDRHLLSQNRDVGAVGRGLRKHFGACTKDRVNLSVGSGIVAGREWVWEIPVPPGSELEPVLNTGVPLDQQVTAAVTTSSDDALAVAAQAGATDKAIFANIANPPAPTGSAGPTSGNQL